VLVLVHQGGGGRRSDAPYEMEQGGRIQPYARTRLCAGTPTCPSPSARSALGLEEVPGEAAASPVEGPMEWLLDFRGGKIASAHGYLDHGEAFAGGALAE
jgi:hypothetical protein